MKIVICGPPHSGKSVFVQQLREALLPRGVIGVIEGCPDGEGGWAGSTDQNLAKSLRVKGQFTATFVNWVIESVRGSKMPVTLIDVGGIRSPENERIFSECDGFVVLANPEKFDASGRPELEAWHEFGKRLGCKPVALISSELFGQSSLAPDQGDDVIRGVQANLERGTRTGGPLLEKLIERLLEIASKTAAPGELEANVHTGRLASQLGIPVENRGARVGFRPWLAGACLALSAAALAAPICKVWGACPSWLPALLAAGAKQMELWDIRLGYVPIPELSITESGAGPLTWRVTEHGDRTVVAFSIPGGVFHVAQLATVTPPAIPAGRAVVLSGRGPHWLMAAVAATYARVGHPVAVLALAESSEPLPDGNVWNQVHPDEVPAVVVATGGAWKEIGTMVTVPVALARG